MNDRRDPLKAEGPNDGSIRIREAQELLRGRAEKLTGFVSIGAGKNQTDSTISLLKAGQDPLRRGKGPGGFIRERIERHEQQLVLNEPCRDGKPFAGQRLKLQISRGVRCHGRTIYS